jgi:hypothetical protein
MTTTTAPVEPWQGIDFSRLVQQAPVGRKPAVKTPAAGPSPAAESVDFDFEGDVLARGRRNRDGGVRASATTAMDGQNRVSLGKVAKLMSWADDVELVTVTAGHRVLLRPRNSDDGARVAPATVDQTGRLVLSPPVRVALDVVVGERVQAVAIPAEDHIVLFAEQDLLTALTGPVEVPDRKCAAIPTATKSRSTRMKRSLYR